VTVTSGSARVIGDVNCDWSQVVAGYSWFCLLSNQFTVLTVMTKTAPGSSASGFWEVTLESAYIGSTLSGQSYVIHKDFSLLNNYPIFGPGDVKVDQIINRFIQAVDKFALVVVATAFNFPTVSLHKPVLVFFLNNDTTSFYQLQTGAPSQAGDIATIDDANARFRQTFPPSSQVSSGAGITTISSLSISTLNITKPSAFLLVVGSNRGQLWQLQAGAPASGDVATIDDVNSRWRQIL